MEARGLSNDHLSGDDAAVAVNRVWSTVGFPAPGQEMPDLLTLPLAMGGGLAHCRMSVDAPCQNQEAVVGGSPGKREKGTGNREKGKLAAPLNKRLRRIGSFSSLRPCQNQSGLPAPGPFLFGASLCIGGASSAVLQQPDAAPWHERLGGREPESAMMRKGRGEETWTGGRWTLAPESGDGMAQGRRK